MELETIITLVKAGYTKDEIAKMEEPVSPVPDAGKPAAPAAEPAAAPGPAQQAAPDAKPAAESVPAPAQAAAPAAAPGPTMADLMLQMAKLTSAIQANAIANSIIPGGANEGPTAEDMLAQIIRPTRKERET